MRRCLPYEHVGGKVVRGDVITPNCDSKRPPSPIQFERYMGHQNLGGNKILMVSIRRVMVLLMFTDPDRPQWVCGPRLLSSPPLAL